MGFRTRKGNTTLPVLPPKGLGRTRRGQGEACAGNPGTGNGMGRTDAHRDPGQEGKSFALGDPPRPPLTPWRASDTPRPARCSVSHPVRVTDYRLWGRRRGSAQPLPSAKA